MTYDEREKRRQDYYAAVHVDRLLNSMNAVMKVADREQAGLRAALAFKQGIIDDLAATVERLEADE